MSYIPGIDHVPALKTASTTIVTPSSWRGHELKKLDSQLPLTSKVNSAALSPLELEKEIARIKELPQPLQTIVENYVIDKTKAILKIIEKNKIVPDFFRPHLLSVSCLDLSDKSMSNRQIAFLIDGFKNLIHFTMPKSTDCNSNGLGGKMTSSRQIYHLIFKNISQLNKLTHLDISYWINKNVSEHLTKIQIEQLLSKKQLKYLNLSGCQNNDDFIPVIITQKTLTDLNLGSSKMLTNTGFSAIAALSRLEHLELCDNELITDEGFKSFENHPKLRHLKIKNFGKITDKAIESLSTCSALKHVEISSCPKLTNSSLVSLAKIPTLDSLNIAKCTHI